MQFTCRLPNIKQVCEEIKQLADKNNPRPRIPLQELDANVCAAQTAAFAEGTLAHLTTQWGGGGVRYLEFCTLYSEQALPASPVTLCRYAQYLIQLGLKAHGSLLCYLSGVAFIVKPPPVWF